MVLTVVPVVLVVVVMGNEGGAGGSIRVRPPQGFLQPVVQVLVVVEWNEGGGRVIISCMGVLLRPIDPRIPGENGSRKGGIVRGCAGRGGWGEGGRW